MCITNSLRRSVLSVGLMYVLFNPVLVAAQADHEPIVVGHHRTLDSKILGEQRLLYVHLPEGYEESGRTYPVVFQLYAHFQGSYFLPQVRDLDVMAAYGTAPEMILVGLETRDHRYRDLLPVDHFGATSEIEKFLTFFREELVPFIEENYRAGGYRILSAPQAGAAFGLYALAREPDLFGSVIASNPFWIEPVYDPLVQIFGTALDQGRLNNHTLIVSYEADESEAAVRLIEAFSDDLSRRALTGFDFLLNPLPVDYGYAVTVDFENGLRHIFKDFELSREGEAVGIAEIETRFARLERKLGLSVKPAELAMIYQADKYQQRGDVGKAEEMLHYIKLLYPESLMSFVRLGDIELERGNKDAALNYYEQFRRIRPESSYILSKIRAIKNN